MPGFLKNFVLNVEISPIVIWRLKLFQIILRFAVWVGGFAGVEVVEREEIPFPTKSELAVDVYRRCTACDALLEGHSVYYCDTCAASRRSKKYGSGN